MHAQEQLRVRAAHHEAAHAVIAASDYALRAVFLTHGTTDDGSLGGYTGWDN